MVATRARVYRVSGYRLDRRDRTAVVQAAKHSAAMIRVHKAVGSAKRRRKVPRQRYPMLLEVEYGKVLAGLVRSAAAALQPLKAQLPQLLESAARARGDSADRPELVTEEVAGLLVVIENPVGSTRSWSQPDGTSGETLMRFDYGYIAGAIGADGEDVDVYLGPVAEPEWVFVVHQQAAPDFESYDEDKVMLGFASADVARDAYIAQYNDPRFFGGMSTFSIEAFRAKLREIDGKLTHADADEGKKARQLVGDARQKFTTAINPTQLEALAEKFGKRVSDAQRAEFSRQVRSALGVDIFAHDQRLPAIMDHFVSENVALITRIPERLFSDVESKVTRAFTLGKRHEELAADIAKSESVSESAARLIARDQIGKLNGQVNASRQQDIGIQRFTWRTVGDERVREEHEELDGQDFDYDDPPSEGLPGEPINCVPGDALVSLHAPAVKAFRRWYSGELTELVTDALEPLRCTPNHPVLTARGWLAAHLVQVGDYLVEAPAHRLQLAVEDPERRDPLAAEVFCSLASLGVSHRVHGSASRFHGDGSDEEIDVVEVDRRLLDEAQIKTREMRGEDGLPVAAESTLTVRHVPTDRVALPPTADRIMRGGGESAPVLGRGLAHPQEHGFATRARGDASGQQDASDAGAGNVESMRDDLLAEAARVGRDDLVFRKVSAVVRQPWSGLVYNFETTTGWFGCHGLIVHNCRCTAEPIFDDILDEIDPEGADDAQPTFDDPVETKLQREFNLAPAPGGDDEE